MEIANHWSSAIDPQRVRTAAGEDAAEIRSLLQTAAYRHLHVDWYLPGDWLGSESFVVIDPPLRAGKPTVRRRLFGQRLSLAACLAAAADPPPAAWVRVAAVRQEIPALKALAAMMESIVPVLQRQQVQELAWLSVYDWINPLLPSLGFSRSHALETYVREPAPLPVVPEIPNLTIRAVMKADLQILEQIEAAAFNPLWRQSARGLALAQSQTISFEVVQDRERVIGYQMSTATDSGAHLVRMTLDPAYQQKGIGSFLLAHILHGYAEAGLGTASLNTQVDNHPSRRLYEKFGFRSTGQILPIWVLSL